MYRGGKFSSMINKLKHKTVKREDGNVVKLKTNESIIVFVRGVGTRLTEYDLWKNEPFWRNNKKIISEPNN